MRRTYHLTLAAALGALVAGCADGGDPLDGRGFDGPGLEIDVAALTLEGVADAEWHIAVDNCELDGQGVCNDEVADPAEPVFETTISSSQYGDGAGSATYIGPCDATTQRNRVSVTLNWIEDDAGVSLDFQNPGTLTRWADCDENADTLVAFNVTVLRPAQQGFFDIAVDFNDIYCSAKYDCAVEDLLHDPATGQRGDTHVLGFACSGGIDDGGETALYLDDLTITCGAEEISLPLPLIDQPDGNQGAAGPDADTSWLYQWAVYRGDELLEGVNKRYYNVALGLGDDLPAGCTITTTGTAEGSESVVLEDGAVPAGVVYPYIAWDIDDLDTCDTNHQVNAAGSGVQTEYTETTGAGHAFDHAVFASLCPNGTYAYQGTFVYSTGMDDEEVDCLEVIDGSLIIHSQNDLDVTFPSLTSIQGTEQQAYVGSAGSQGVTVRFPVLQSLGGRIDVGSANGPVVFDAPMLESVENVSVTSNGATVDLQVPSLGAAPDGVLVQGNSAAVDMDASGLGTVGAIEIASNGGDISIDASEIVTLTEPLSVTGNDGALTLTFTSLEAASTIELDGNGTGPLVLDTPALTTADVVVVNNNESDALTLDLHALETVVELRVRNHPELVATDIPLDSLDEVTDVWDVSHNASLATCYLDAVYGGLSTTPTTTAQEFNDDTATCE